MCRLILAACAALERAYLTTPARLVAVLAILGFVLRAGVAPYGTPLYLDAYAYMLKAIEITRGNFTPIHTHSIGWSIVLAPVMWLSADRPILEQMDRVRMAACAVSAIGIVPLYFITTATVTARAGVIALLLYPFVLKLTSVAFHGMSESVHVLLLLIALAGALRADKPIFMILAGVASGLACWVHPTGVLVPALSVVVLLGANPRNRIASALAVVAVAAVVAAPAAIQRARTFGHAFDFGGNNRFFGESEAQMWSDTLPMPTALDYLRQHGAGTVVKRVVVEGAAVELRDFAEGALTYPVVPFAVWGTWLAWRNRRTRPLVVMSALFLAAWTVPYPVLGGSRHLVPILPIAFLFVALAVGRVADHPNHGVVWAAALVSAFAVGHSIAAGVQRYRQLHSPAIAGLEWGGWIAGNVRGRVAVREGQELIMMHLPDAAIGGFDINTIAAPRSGLALVKPGYFPTVDDALAWMRDDGVTHLVLDNFLDPPAYLAPLRAHPRQPYLTELFSTVGRSPWPVRVVAISWPSYRGQTDTSR